MGPDLKVKRKSGSNRAAAFSGQKFLEPGTNCIGEAFGIETMQFEQPPMSNGDEDVEVSIAGCTNSGKALVVEDSCGSDATESSSSFGDTGSGTENAPSLSDIEVESRFCAHDVSSSMVDDCCESLQRRKKSVTSHWRKFIRPLMWRCRWIELKLRQLKSQEHKYKKELAIYNYTKELDFAHLTLDGFDIKSVPISGRMHRNKIMKRNKRNRVEEKGDLESYMRNHNLFSYYGQTDRSFGACFKDFCGVATGDNDDDNEFMLDDLWTYVDHENDDKSLNEIIQKIEAVQSQVHSLKTRIEKVNSENSRRLESITRLNMPGPSDRFNHAELNSAPCPGEQNMNPVSFCRCTSQLDLEYHMGDPLIPGNASLIREGASLLNEAIGRPELEDLCGDAEAVALNQSAEEELHDSENVGGTRVSEAGVAAEDAVPNVHSSMKSCPILKSDVPRNKRKRREKSGSNSWSLRSFD